MIAYKFLRADGTSVFTSFAWPLPGGSSAGDWVSAPVDPCRSGLHFCRVGDLPLWIGRTLYEAELDGEVLEQPFKVVAGRARLLRRVDAWDEPLRAAFTRMCADRAHALAAEGGLEQWDAVVEPSVPEGPALLGFVAARIAEHRFGERAYRDERARQAAWLARRLGLPAEA